VSGTCTANSNCGFSSVKEYFNGTCSEGGEGHSRFRTNETKCIGHLKIMKLDIV